MIKLILALLNLLRLWKRVRPAEEHEQIAAGPDIAPPVRTERKSKNLNSTPWLRQPGETAAEWQERVNPSND